MVRGKARADVPSHAGFGAPDRRKGIGRDEDAPAPTVGSGRRSGLGRSRTLEIMGSHCHGAPRPPRLCGGFMARPGIGRGGTIAVGKCRGPRVVAKARTLMTAHTALPAVAAHTMASRPMAGPSQKAPARSVAADATRA